MYNKYVQKMNKNWPDRDNTSFYEKGWLTAFEMSFDVVE